MLRFKKGKRNFIRTALGLLLPAAMLWNFSMTGLAANGTSYVFDGYIYDVNRNVVESPAAFQLKMVIDSDSLPGMTFQGADDVCTAADGRIFITDKNSSRVFVFDKDGNFLKAIKTIWNKEGTIQLDEDGNQIALVSPEGAYVHEKNQELYIADPVAGCVFVLDSEDYTYKRVITQPEGMSGVTSFAPSKVTVDQADRIFIVVQSSYEGIIELAADGSFIGYYGVNTPVVNLVEYFWKSLATDTQKAQMSKTLAPAFNNVAVDGEGFIMAVTSDSSASDMIYRLNSKGEDVKREEGNTFLIGDLQYGNTEPASQFIDIAVTDFGVYAVVDQARGRIFLYDFDGEQLIAFGCLGSLQGQFKTPTSIAWQGYNLIVTDSTLQCAYVFTPTQFGDAMLHGSEEYYNGNWDAALGYFQEAVSYNANYAVGYTGIGKNYLMKDEYEKALYYFKQGGNRIYYSKAYYGYRGEQLKEHFGIVMTILVALIVWLIWSEISYNRKAKRKKA